MNHRLLSHGVPVVTFMATLLLTGCIDDNYDLSDIDTTSEFKVNDLVVPVNIDPIVLSDIISIEDNGKIKVVNINGKEFYAVEERGDFKSDPIEIKTFTAKIGNLNDTHSKFLLSTNNTNPKRRRLPSFKYQLNNKVEQTLNYNASGVDGSIHSITNIGVENLTFVIKITIDDSSLIETAVINDLVLEMPKGLSIKSISPAQSGGYGYNSANGQLKVETLNVVNGTATLTIVTDKIDLAANNTTLNYNDHTLNLNSKLDITNASISITPKSNVTESQTPSQIDFTVNYTLTDLIADSFSGTVEYSLEGDGLKIDPIHLNDLPSFLADEQTNLILYNPQIYLNINNPVGNSGLSYQSGLKITSNFNDGKSTTVKLDDFKVGHGKGTGPYNFCLSPENPTIVPNEYSTDMEHVTFNNLGNILSGAGLPSSLDLELINPEIYLQTVNDFKLGTKLPEMRGNYLFLAPLAMKGTSDSGSKIVYTYTADGWSSEDLDAVTINLLKVNADATSTVPLSADLYAYPIDKDGNVIQGVEVNGVKLPGGATDTPIEISMTGEIKMLDGVRIEAVVRSTGTGEALAPSQTITLKNIRARVTGNYTKDF